MGLLWYRLPIENLICMSWIDRVGHVNHPCHFLTADNAVAALIAEFEVPVTSDELESAFILV